MHNKRYRVGERQSEVEGASGEGVTSGGTGVRETERDGDTRGRGGVEVKGGLGDSAYMQISSCENSDAGGRIVSDKATGSQGQYQSNDEKRVADDPGNVQEGSTREENKRAVARAGWLNRDKTLHTVLIAIATHDNENCRSRAKRGEIYP